MLARLALLFALALPAQGATEKFYLGTFTNVPGGSRGIYLGTLDSVSGQLGPVRLAAAETDPNFLALSPDHRYVFAALDDAVESFAVRPDGTLRAINCQATGGGETCHVALDHAGREVFAASFGTGTISGFPVGAGGRIGPRVAFAQFTGSGPNRTYQKSPHAHSVYVDPSDRFLYACDLGSDHVWIFRRDGQGGMLLQPPEGKLPSGSGPRHLAFDPDDRFLYVASQMGVSTSVFRRDRTNGRLELLDTNANLPGGFRPDTGSAEIEVHPSGKWLYVSTRVTDRLTVFRIHRDRAHGRLEYVEDVPSPVMFPRSFAIDPSGRWMIVAGQNGNQLAVMRIDPISGRLTALPDRVAVGSPVCVLFVPTLP